DLPIDRGGGFNRAGTDATVTGFFHQGDGENAPRHHVGNRGGRDNAIDRRGHHRHSGRPAAQVPQQGKGGLHHVIARPATVQQRAQQYKNENIRNRNAQGHPVDPFGGQPHV